MKKINNLFILIATVCVLGMTSCDSSNDPKPVDTTLSLADFDGEWKTVTTTYEGVTYNAEDVCDQLKDVIYQNITLNVMSSVSEIEFTNHCLDFTQNWLVDFNSETQVITVTGSGNQKYEILEYNLNSTPKVLRLEIIDNGIADILTENLIYFLKN